MFVFLFFKMNDDFVKFFCYKIFLLKPSNLTLLNSSLSQGSAAERQPQVCTAATKLKFYNKDDNIHK